jgi:hypothetical protein
MNNTYIFIYKEYDGIYPIDLPYKFVVSEINNKLSTVTNPKLEEIYRRNIKIIDIKNESSKNMIKSIMRNDFVLIHETKDKLSYFSKYNFMLQAYRFCSKIKSEYDVKKYRIIIHEIKNELKTNELKIILAQVDFYNGILKILEKNEDKEYDEMLFYQFIESSIEEYKKLGIIFQIISFNEIINHIS